MIFSMVTFFLPMIQEDWVYCKVLYPIIILRSSCTYFYHKTSHQKDLPLMKLSLKHGSFHAREYPAYDKDVFPYYMGFCQTGRIFWKTVQSVLKDRVYLCAVAVSQSYCLVITLKIFSMFPGVVTCKFLRNDIESCYTF